MRRMLVVEDQKGHLMALKYAVNGIAQNYLPNLTNDAVVDLESILKQINEDVKK
ncbi:MAG TPA: hypothetical protein VJK03_00590 [Candidatus Nanoarchaeia archaeon]|nr:hypothetical protein [Candidatus Nanoarchaeia archaeon]